MFFTWKRLFALQGQNYNFTKTLFWKHQMIEQKICDPLAKILLFLDLYFERYACLKIMSRLMSQLMAHELFDTQIFWLGTTCESTHESTPKVWVDPWVDSCSFYAKNYRTLFSGILPQRSTHESTPKHELTPVTGFLHNS